MSKSPIRWSRRAVRFLSLPGLALAALVASCTNEPTGTGGQDAELEFELDTIRMSRVAHPTDVVIRLQEPAAADLTLSVGFVGVDTIADLEDMQILIPAGSDSGAAVILGRHEGITRMFVEDPSGTLEADTATLIVEPYVMIELLPSVTVPVVGEASMARVTLSTPSPPGGMSIDFVHSVAGIVTVTPHPVVVPEGHLAADLSILGVAAGDVTLTARASGTTSGSTFLVVHPRALIPSTTGTMVVGVGQYLAPSVSSPGFPRTQIALTVSSSSPTIASVTPTTATLLPNVNSFIPLHIEGLAPGSATITTSAATYAPTNFSVRVTTPRVGICCTDTVQVTDTAFTVRVLSTDSTTAVHPRISALQATLSSGDPSIVEIITPMVTIAAGATESITGRARPTGALGAAWLYVNAPGHLRDSVRITVAAPTLIFQAVSPRLGVGQMDHAARVFASATVSGPITLTASDPAVLGVPPTVTAGAPFEVRALTTGSSTLIASAPGFAPETLSYVVTSPIAYIIGGGALERFAPNFNLLVRVADSLRVPHWTAGAVIMTVTSSDPSVIAMVQDTDTIDAGTAASGDIEFRVVGVGTATLTATAPGHLPTSITYTVHSSALDFPFTEQRVIGRRQYPVGGIQSVRIPRSRTVDVPVTLSRRNPSVDSLTTSTVVILAGQTHGSFGITGMNIGTDTIIASASDYAPDTMLFVVSRPTLRGEFLISGLVGAAEAHPTFISAGDTVGNEHLPLDSILVAVTSSDPSVLEPIDRGVWIPKGTRDALVRLRYVGVGSASLTFRDSLGTGPNAYLPYTTNVAHGQLPPLLLENHRPILGIRQNGGTFGATLRISAARAQPLIVSLASGDAAVASVPTTVTIPAGATSVPVSVTAHDVTGTVQIAAQASGFLNATMSQQVTSARLFIEMSATAITTGGARAIMIRITNESGLPALTNESFTITLASSNPAAGTVSTSSVVVPAGVSFHNTATFLPAAPGTTTITASDPRVGPHKYQGGTKVITVLAP